MNRRRLTAGVAGLALLLGLGVAPPVQQTDAAWVDSEYGGTTIKAATLVTPTITSCNVSTLLNLGIVFVNARITWTSQYPIDRVRLYMRPPGGADQIVPQANYVENAPPSAGMHSYTVTVNQNLLQNILVGVLGSTTVLSVRAVAGDNWRSVNEATANLSVGGLLGLAGTNTCAIV